MPGLSLIVGPPNSGKAGAVRARLEVALARDPLLIVPTLDDTGRFEAELCEQAGSAGTVVGASIGTFEHLFGQVAKATGASLPPPLTRAQARHVARLAAGSAKLEILRRSSRRPGFAPALATLVGELQSAGIDPDTFGADAAEHESSAYLSEIARLYRAYTETRDSLGRGDVHLAAARATAALRTSPEAWGARPVFFYGFDDLTPEQLALVDALVRATDVTFAVPYEDRLTFRARSRLQAELRELGPAEELTMAPDPHNTASSLLYELERRFLRGRVAELAGDESLIALEAAGQRNQAEQIGGEVARLLADGVAPDAIAVVVRDPDREGPMLHDVFDSFQIPVAVEARVPLRATATGRGLTALARAARPGGTAADILAFVRSPGMAPPGDADWLERRILRRRLRTAAEALDAWQGRELFELSDIAAAESSGGSHAIARTLARLARRLSQRFWERRAAQESHPMRLELHAGEAAAAALEELAELPNPGGQAVDAIAALDEVDVALWRGPSEGRVLVTSPYRIRARRVEYLFVASLQEGEFPRLVTGEPFLSDEQRGAVRLPRRATPEDEERYLFAVCLSRPTRRLYLSWRSSDDEGAEEAPSAFLDDVRELLDRSDAPDGVDPLARRLRRRHLADVTAPLGDAPAERELLRAIASARARPDSIAGIDPVVATAIARRLDASLERARRRRPGPLHLPAVLEALRQRSLFGASTLELYGECSYRWFVQHELRPRELEPEPEVRAQGSVIHAVLERLYRDPPAGEAPKPATLGAWRGRAAELVAELAPEHGLGSGDARGLAARARMQALVEGQLEREAGIVTRLQPDRELLEASFGDGEGDIAPPLDLGEGVRLHGKIDRVDVSPEGTAGLVQDYKVTRRVTTGANLAKEAKLQPQLYSMALAELWGKRALGGLFQPLAGTSDHRPRGIALREEAEPGGLLSGLNLARNDLLDGDDMSAAIDGAAAEARRIAADMRSGRITRDPLRDRCPTYCTFQGICRRERAARIEQEPGFDEEEEE
jgi:ATP-dependent helicase/DNAse subunit B